MIDKEKILTENILKLQTERQELLAGSNPNKDLEIRIIDNLIELERLAYYNRETHALTLKEIENQRKIYRLYQKAFELASDPNTRKTITKILAVIAKEKKKIWDYE